MNCSRALESLSAYHDGELDARTAEEVRAHLAGCPSCRREAEEATSTAKLLRSTAASEPPPLLINRTMARIREEGRRVGWALGEALKVRHMVPVATATLLVLILSAGVLPREGGPTSSLRPEGPGAGWISVDPVMHGEAGIALTMEDLRSFQPISSGEYLLALGAMREIPRTLIAPLQDEAEVRFTHIIDLDAGEGRIESEITFSEE